MIFYTIFLGDKPWEDVIDDMNTTEIWARGGMFWSERIKAEACMEDLQKTVYGFETDKKKFKIVELKLV